MKHAEMKLFFEKSLHPMARCLYVALRFCADYKTGIAKVSTSKLARLISHEPKSKSSADEIAPTRKQMRVWLSSLEEIGLIELREPGTRSDVAAWFLPLFPAEISVQKAKTTGATENTPTGATQNTVTARPVAKTGATQNTLTGARQGPHKTPQQGPQENQAQQGLQGEQGPVNFPNRGHYSNIKDKSNIYDRVRDDDFGGETEGGENAQEITLDSQFLMAARSVGQTLPFDQLTLIFIDFQNNKHNRYKNQGRADWLADWRSWCAKSKLFHSRSLSNANQQPAGNSSRPISKADVTRNVFEFAAAAAAKLANGED